MAAVRSRYRFTYLDDEYSMSEALLWLGIYLAVNLQTFVREIMVGHWWREPVARPSSRRLFYWATWVLTWCVPPTVLARGLRRKDRLVIAVGRSQPS